MDESWQSVLAPHRALLASLLERADIEGALPQREYVFKALVLPRQQVQAIILGQDPYPTPGMAEGLAFSVPPSVTKLPPSLKNIFSEYVDDLQLAYPASGHLGKWVDSGVLLLNRVLTVRPGAPLSHQGIGWEQVTDSVLQSLVADSIPIVCWGAPALAAARKVGFPDSTIFSSAHPSPLSAYRGFFGSKPFSSVNKFLVVNGRKPIDWQL